MKRGTQIIYIPTHAEGDKHHPDCEHGFVTSMNGSGTVAFCRYWKNQESNELRTYGNSEGTVVDNIIAANTRPQRLVEQMLENYC